MLNQIEKIDAIDSAHMVDTIAQFPQQLEEAQSILNQFQIPDFIKVDNVVVSGMGASGISGDIVQSLFHDKLDVPFFVNKSYDLPKWVHKNTLSVILSYSGDTEETLSSFKQAVQKKCHIVAVTSGGKLAEYCEKREITCIHIPKGFQPRAATAYLLVPLLFILRKNGVIKNTLESDLAEARDVVKRSCKLYAKNVPLDENPAKQLAQDVQGTILKLYGWGLYAPVALRWRTQLNENSKLIADFDIVPDANHNDIIGWTGDAENAKHFSCLLFRDSHEESIYMKTRLDFMKVLFEDVAHVVKEVRPEGKSRLARMLYCMNLGDFVSCYLAFLRGQDPTPIDAITELKNRLSLL